MLRLAHGWRLVRAPEGAEPMVRDFIRPAVRAVPSAMARRLGAGRIALTGDEAGGISSQWTRTSGGLDILVTTAGSEDHDIAMELLLCAGQALWERLSDAELRGYWRLLDGELALGVDAEIDEQALEEKRALLQSRMHARSASRLERYGRASFAATAAEYVHSLWHDVTVREGPGYLPAEQVRRRLELLARWFPPNRGYRLFPVRTPTKLRP